MDRALKDVSQTSSAGMPPGCRLTALASNFNRARDEAVPHQVSITWSAGRDDLRTASAIVHYITIAANPDGYDVSDWMLAMPHLRRFGYSRALAVPLLKRD